MNELSGKNTKREKDFHAEFVDYICKLNQFSSACITGSERKEKTVHRLVVEIFLRFFKLRLK